MIQTELSKDSLPDGGWQAALESYYTDDEPNCLCLLSANVDPNMRNLKFSYALLEQGKALARKLGLSAMIAPVRPSQKHQFPYMEMAEYLEKRLETGEAFDPWLRVHLNLGGEILNVCTQSVVVRATLSKWHEWTKFSPAQSGLYLVPTGLVPLAVDLDHNIGIYSEPNVWVRYKLDK